MVAGASLKGVGDLDDFMARWIAAEARGDAAALAALLDEDFSGDGPRGFVLTKGQWLERYRTGDLINESFDWRATQVRVNDHTAVVMGVQEQTARYQGHDCSGRFHVTLVAVRRDDGWSVVNVQLSADTPP